MLGSFILLLALFYVGMQVAAFFSELLVVIVVGSLISFLLYEVSYPLARIMPWWLAVSLTYLIFLALIGIAIAMLIPSLVDQIGQLVQSIPRYADRMEKIMAQWQVFLEKRHFKLDLPFYLAKFTEYLQTGLSSLSSFLPTLLLTGFSTLLDGAFAFILSIYLLMDYELLWNRVTGLFFVRFRPFMQYVRYESYKSLHSFVVGSVLGGLFLFITDFIAFSLCGFKYSLIASVLYGLLIVVPYFGPMIATLMLLLLSALQGNWWIFLAVNISAFVFLNIQGYVLAPYIFSESMGLHPIAVLLVLLVGARIAGFLGLLLSIPVAGLVFAVLKAIWWIEEEGVAPAVPGDT